MIEDLVKNLKSENAELQMHCASAIFKVKVTFFEINKEMSPSRYGISSYGYNRVFLNEFH